mmetsp:Transcript_75506/g.218050  ORF Transcript_75506/g.218050 Transcript_75506/m.218050 type:complete len:268 (+) Transcript_75506:39-842(+)
MARHTPGHLLINGQKTQLKNLCWCSLLKLLPQHPRGSGGECAWVGETSSDLCAANGSRCTQARTCTDRARGRRMAGTAFARGRRPGLPEVPAPAPPTDQGSRRSPPERRHRAPAWAVATSAVQRRRGGSARSGARPVLGRRGRNSRRKYKGPPNWYEFAAQRHESSHRRIPGSCRQSRPAARAEPAQRRHAPTCDPATARLAHALSVSAGSQWACRRVRAPGTPVVPPGWAASPGGAPPLQRPKTRTPGPPQRRARRAPSLPKCLGP